MNASMDNEMSSAVNSAINKQGSVVWIVGASSGIGRALALEYAKHSPTKPLYLSARSEDKLQALKAEIEALGATAEVLPLDISKPDQLLEAEARLASKDIAISTAIINAGTCEYMDSHAPDVAMARRVFETNYLAAVELSRICLPLLRKAKQQSEQASLVFVSSSVTYQALPRAHAYGASKAALRYFAECLRVDWQLEDIQVQVVSPGFVDTPLTEKNDFEMPLLISSADAAQRIYAKIGTSRFDIAFPKRFVAGLKVFSMLPSALRFKLLGKMSRHPFKSAKQAQSHIAHSKGSI